jgi:hypothetical protein
MPEGHEMKAGLERIARRRAQGSAKHDKRAAARQKKYKN